MQKLYNCFEKSKEAMHEEYIYSLNTCDFVKRCVALFIANPMEKALVGEIKVRALVLKYSITSTLGEMYCANIKTPEKWKSHYDNVSNDSRAHYLWLLDTYYAMPSEMKENLKTIFENTHAWRLLNIGFVLSLPIMVEAELTTFANILLQVLSLNLLLYARLFWLNFGN